ncbi:MAG: energy-coupling factor transporter transmembrane protein EcfT [Pyrinomonadaceae bacterium]|nr:energy-coupling factor transporter transmembrane protein EcfT [Pyrinomonadaceae bacterium]
MKIFGYLDGDSFIHKLDPRTKIIGLFAVSGLLFVFNHPAYVFILFCFALLISLTGGVLSRIFRLIIPLSILAIVSMITWPFYLKGGTELFSIGGIVLSKEALLYGIAMGFRWAGAIVLGIIFLSITRPDDFYAAMIKLKIPYSVAFVTSLTFRLVPSFIGSGVEIKEAQVSRGLDLNSGGIFSRVRKWMVLAVPLFMNAIQQTTRMTVALESRAFGSRTTRTFYRKYEMKRRDFAVLIISSLMLLLCIFLRVNGFGVLLTDRL